MDAIRYVDDVTLVPWPGDADTIPLVEDIRPDAWIVPPDEDTIGKSNFCAAHGVEYRALTRDDLQGYPVIEPEAQPSSRKRVLVTGCYDWFHSGHVRFFEEVSELGDLYVVVGHDDNIKLLKGEGHPMFPQDERRYVVQAVRHVKQALISTGYGWLDAEPEIERIKPDIYAVNHDGDVPEKRQFCERKGIEYVILKRVPREGLPKRESTALRGF
jgi:cytidyltransferase-like protein